MASKSFTKEKVSRIQNAVLNVGRKEKTILQIIEKPRSCTIKLLISYEKSRHMLPVSEAHREESGGV